MRNVTAVNEWKVVPLASGTSTVHKSDGEARVHLGSPSIAVLPGGRIVVAVDQFGPGVRDLPGPKGRLNHFNRWLESRVFTSNDKGQTWTFRQDCPFCNPCLFRDGPVLYLLGHDDDLQIMRSSDGGETWTKPAALTKDGNYGDSFTQAPAGALCANGSIYLVAMKVTDFGYRGDLVSTLAPVAMRAKEGGNLASTKSWVFSSPDKAFRDLAAWESVAGAGIPFYAVRDRHRGEAVANGRWAHRMGWSAPHIVQIKDSRHYWHDPAGRTLHILARGATHRSNIAALAKAVEDESGNMSLALEKTPSGADLAFLPLPGGNLKFDLLYDETSALYWLVSNQIADSMTRAKLLPPDRHGLPCDDTQRLQLHFSRNLVDWRFAGMIAAGGQARESRYGCGMAIRGNDLCVVFCGGDAACRNSQETNQISFCTIPDFRELAY
jgi:hypothetical protein